MGAEARWRRTMLIDKIARGDRGVRRRRLAGFSFATAGALASLYGVIQADDTRAREDFSAAEAQQRIHDFENYNRVGALFLTTGVGFIWIADTREEVLRKMLTRTFDPPKKRPHSVK